MDAVNVFRLITTKTKKEKTATNKFIGLFTSFSFYFLGTQPNAAFYLIYENGYFIYFLQFSCYSSRRAGLIPITQSYPEQIS